MLLKPTLCYLPLVLYELTYQYKFINNVVNKVQSTKFLIVYIDERLCCHKHVNMLYTILLKSLGLLKAASVYLPRDILLSMFYSFLIINCSMVC